MSESENELGGVRPPRAPRRRQVEVDEARHDANVARAELAAVRADLRRLRGAVRRAQVSVTLEEALRQLDAALEPTPKVVTQRESRRDEQPAA